MALPTKAELLTLNWAWRGQPFVQVPATTGIVTTTLDTAYRGQPFVAVEEASVEDVILWGGGRLTLYAGGVLGSVSAQQGAAYARALAGGYGPETDAGRGAGEVDAEAGASTGSADAPQATARAPLEGASLALAASSSHGAGLAALQAGGRTAEPESGHIQTDGVDDYIYGANAAQGVSAAGWTFIVKIADKTPYAEQAANRYIAILGDDEPALSGGASRIDALYVSTEATGADPRNNIQFIGARTTGSSWYLAYPTDARRGPLTISVYTKNTVPRRKDILVIQNGGVLYRNTKYPSVDDATAGRTPLHITAAVRNLAGTLSLFSKLQLVAVALINDEAPEAEVVAYSQCRDAREVWTDPARRHRYYALAQAAGSSVPDIGGDGLVPLALLGGLSDADVRLDDPGLVGLASAARGNAQTPPVLGAGYLPMGDTSAAWGAGALGYTQAAGGCAGLADELRANALVELEAAGLVSWVDHAFRHPLPARSPRVTLRVRALAPIPARAPRNTLKARR